MFNKRFFACVSLLIGLCAPAQSQNAEMVLWPQEMRRSITLARDDGAWVSIVQDCYQKDPYAGIGLTCADLDPHYDKIIAVMREAGFNRTVQEFWDSATPQRETRWDVAYQVRISPNGGGSMAFEAYTPHPGLHMNLMDTLPLAAVRVLPNELAKLHAKLYRAAKAINTKESPIWVYR